MEILMNVSGTINQVIGWGMSIMTGLLILRATNDFIRAFSDDIQITLKEAIRKVKNRIFAVVIALTIDGTIIWIQHFYR